jgi:hypothetical protein
MNKKTVVWMFLAVVFAMIMLVLIASASNPPMVKVDCGGCYSINEVPGGYEFYADSGEKINLVGSAVGGDGAVRYVWTKNGKSICSLSSCLVIVAESAVEYVFTATDNKGRSSSKIVKVIPKFKPEKSKCLPNFKSGIILHDWIEGRTEWSAGDSFALEVKLKEDGCSNYDFHWETNNPDVVIENKNSAKTGITIRKSAKAGMSAVIKAVLSNELVTRSREINIKIVGNTKPQAIVRYDQLRSYTKFKVYCGESKTGTSGNENNDFISKCSVVLKDEQGRIVSQDSKTARNGKTPVLKLKAKAVGIYTIVLTVWDSHGLSATASEKIGVVKGNTGKDVPVIYTQDVVYCLAGEVCKISAYETVLRDEKVSKFSFYDVTYEEQNKERLTNKYGFCSSSVCSHIFGYPGTYKIKITASYFGSDKSSSKIITVVVKSDKDSQVSKPKPTPIPERQSQQLQNEVYHYSSSGSGKFLPGMEIIMAMAMIMVACIIKRKRR